MLLRGMLLRGCGRGEAEYSKLCKKYRERRSPQFRKGGLLGCYIMCMRSTCGVALRTRHRICSAPSRTCAS